MAAARPAPGLGPGAGSAGDPRATGDPPAGTKAAATATSPGQRHPPGTNGELAALPPREERCAACVEAFWGGAGTPSPAAKGSLGLLFSGHSGISKT